MNYTKEDFTAAVLRGGHDVTTFSFNELGTHKFPKRVLCTFEQWVDRQHQREITDRKWDKFNVWAKKSRRKSIEIV